MWKFPTTSLLIRQIVQLLWLLDPLLCTLAANSTKSREHLQQWFVWEYTVSCSPSCFNTLSQAVPRETASLNSVKAPVYSLDHLVYKYRQNLRNRMIYCGLCFQQPVTETSLLLLPKLLCAPALCGSAEEFQIECERTQPVISPLDVLCMRDTQIDLSFLDFTGVSIDTTTHIFCVGPR